MKVIPLTHGLVAVISDHRYDYLSRWNWWAKKYGYKWYAERKEEVTRKTIFMHREILNAPSGLQVDHIDGDGLNNLDENLRLCTRAENSRNRGKSKNNTTGYKGVFLIQGRYRAVIGVDMKTIHLGEFSTPEQAARVYDDAARKYFGDFASTNF